MKINSKYSFEIISILKKIRKLAQHINITRFLQIANFIFREGQRVTLSRNFFEIS